MQIIETATKPIKAWVDGVEFDENARKQVENMASLPFVHGHVAVMPDVHVGIGATVGSVIPTVGAIVPAAVGVDIGCFVGETKVPLLDGTQATLAGLAERKEPFWVYSIDKGLRIAPGRATAQKTRSNSELVRVVVSGGDEIICTPDHPFMLFDGAYRQAKDLRFNDSLMPLYRSWQVRDGYESVKCVKGTARQTHEMVWEYFNGEVPSGHVVHHININHFDNRPENLMLVTIGEHSAYHRSIGQKFRNDCPEFQAARMAGIARRKSDPVKLAAMKATGLANIMKYMQERPEHFLDAVAGNGQRGAAYLTKFNTSPRACDLCEFVAENPSVLRWHKHTDHAHNHKVLSITPLDYKADVYCLQVAEHHNFALAAGVFVHNCGMIAQRTSLREEQLPDSMRKIRHEIERTIPVGFAMHKRVPAEVESVWATLAQDFARIDSKYPKINNDRAAEQLATMGGGNHFCEVTIDTEGFVWFVIHSGSRGIGNRIGSFFIDRARREMEDAGIVLVDRDLAYLTENTQSFNDYVEAVDWAQRYAKANRDLMMQRLIQSLRHPNVGLPEFELTETAVNCHHNYVAREHHFGADVFVTRKGAVRAGKGELGIIPGSMGARSFIVRGKGNPESFESCSHGAGRRMGRKEAERRLTLADLERETAGIECRKDRGVLDEAPSAYKSIDAVMAAQAELVEVVHEFRQIVCVKG